MPAESGLYHIRATSGSRTLPASPHKTTEQNVEVRVSGWNGGGGYDQVKTHVYYGLSVDVAGSGKVDAATVIKFGVLGERVEFLP